MDLGEFYKKHKQYYYWKLSRKINGMGLAFHAEDVIHDVVVSMIADENCLAKFEHLTEPEAKAYFMACLTHRMIDIIRREKRHQGVFGNCGMLREKAENRKLQRRNNRSGTIGF